MKMNGQHIARIALIAFLLNVMMPFFAVYNVEHPSPAKEISSLFGEKVLICTGDGFKWVKWADLESGKEKHAPSSHYKCPLCYLAAHGLKDFTAPGTIGLAYNGSATDPGYITYDHWLIVFRLQSPFASRAPPAIFA